MKCQNCNGHIDEGAQFCPDCGQSVAQKQDNHCQFCDTEIKAGQRFCTGCGRATSEAISAPNRCAQCQTSLEPDARFCPQCGATRAPVGDGKPKTSSASVTEKQPAVPIISGTSSRPRKDFSVVVGEEGDSLHWPRAGESPQGESPKVAVLPTEPPASPLSVQKPEQTKTPEKLEFRVADVTPALDLEAEARAKRREVLQQELAEELEKERKIQEAKAEYERQLALERAAQKAAEERKAAEQEASLLEQTQPIPLTYVEQGEIITPSVEQTPETQRSIDELESLIAQLEEKEATLGVAKKPEETAQETPNSAKKIRKPKKEKKIKTKEMPSSSAGSQATEEESGGGSGLRTVLFVVIVLVVATAIAVSLLILFRKQHDTLQEAAMPSTAALQQSLQETTNGMEGVSNPPPSSAEDIPKVEVVESEEVKVRDYQPILIIKPDWDVALPFDELGFARVRQGEGTTANMGLIAKVGTVFLEPTYDEIGAFQGQLATVSLGGVMGYIGTSGAVVIPLEFKDAKPFSNGFAAVKKDGKWGYIDTNGQERIPFLFDSAEDFQNNLARVSSEGEAYFINETGTREGEGYEEISAFSEGFAAAKKEGKWGYLREDFQINGPFEYDKAGPYQQGVAVVAQEGKEFFIDTQNAVSSPKVEEMFSMTRAGVALAKDGGKFGVVDGKSTTFLIEPEYKEGRNFSDGLAAVRNAGGAWHYIDSANQALSAENYAQAEDFHDGIANVRVGADFFMINAHGDIVDSRSWESIGEYSNGMVAVMQGGKWGYLEMNEMPSDGVQSTEETSTLQEPDEISEEEIDTSPTEPPSGIVVSESTTE